MVSHNSHTSTYTVKTVLGLAVFCCQVKSKVVIPESGGVRAPSPAAPTASHTFRAGRRLTPPASKRCREEKFKLKWWVQISFMALCQLCVCVTPLQATGVWQAGGVAATKGYICWVCQPTYEGEHQGRCVWWLWKSLSDFETDGCTASVVITKPLQKLPELQTHRVTPWLVGRCDHWTAGPNEHCCKWATPMAAPVWPHSQVSLFLQITWVYWYSTSVIKSKCRLQIILVEMCLCIFYTWSWSVTECRNLNLSKFSSEKILKLCIKHER